MKLDKIIIFKKKKKKTYFAKHKNGVSKVTLITTWHFNL